MDSNPQLPPPDRANRRMGRQIVRRMVVGGLVGSTALTLLIEATRVVTFPLALVVVLVAAGLTLHRRGRSVLMGSVVTLGLVTSVMVFSPAIDRTVAWLDVGKPPPARADAVVVLGAGIYCGPGELDATSAARLLSGLSLWKAGVAPVIVISDSDPARRPDRCIGQGDAQRRFIDALYPTGGPTIEVLPNMRTTTTEATAVARLATDRGWESVVVVTSPTHTRRARATFRDAGVEPIVVSAHETQYDRSFSRPIHRIRATGLVVRELAGFVKRRVG